jgi:SAM-dependent methyltransferase
MSNGPPPKENTSKNTHAVAAALLYERPQPGAAVLDLPCGEGAFTQRIMQRGFRVWAGDLVRRISLSDAAFTPCDMNKALPFKEGAFDAVVCLDGIEHIERPFDLIRGCARVIRAEGTLVVSTPNISALRSRWRWLLTGFHNGGKSPPERKRPKRLAAYPAAGVPRPAVYAPQQRLQDRSPALQPGQADQLAVCGADPLVHSGDSRRIPQGRKGAGQRARNRAILRQLFAPAVLFGATLLVRARRTVVR